MVARRGGESLIKLEMIKQYQQSCHLFKFSILNNTEIFSGAFAV